METNRLREILLQEMEGLITLSESYVLGEEGIHEMEKGLLAYVLQLCLKTLKWIVAQKLARLHLYHPVLVANELVECKGEKSRTYLSLFGKLEITRPRYCSSIRGSFYKLDELLQLPKGRSWSYNLQELVGENASESDYRESVRVINKLLDLGLDGKSSARNANYLGPLAHTYYEELEILAQTDALCFSASFDGKGVPKITSTNTSTKERLKKGEKRGVKQMATVSVTSSFSPKQRTETSIINGLMGSPLTPLKSTSTDQDLPSPSAKVKSINDNKWHQNIHRRAFLADQKKAVDYGIFNLKQRMGNTNSRFVVPIDAGIGLEDQVLESVEKFGLKDQFDGIIIDIIHVSEYVWECANALLGEQSKLRSDWVREVLTDILKSQTDKVIKDLEQIVDKITLTKSKEKTFNKAINYFKNHQHKMDYQTFISKGYPVSSALVESACGHLVKERMEQSGMRWESQGAQDIMDLRATKLNGDMPQFMDFVIEKQRTVGLSRIAA